MTSLLNRFAATLLRRNSRYSGAGARGCAARHVPAARCDADAVTVVQAKRSWTLSTTAAAALSTSRYMHMRVFICLRRRDLTHASQAQELSAEELESWDDLVHRCAASGTQHFTRTVT